MGMSNFERSIWLLCLAQCGYIFMISFVFALCGSRLKDLDLISSLGHDEKLGKVVTVHAVVVGDYQEGDNDESHDLKGFFLTRIAERQCASGQRY